MTLDSTYQAYLARSMTDKYSALNSHLDNTVREANDESQKLSQKIDGISLASLSTFILLIHLVSAQR